MLIKLVDGAILDIITDTDWSEGCSTCDWGSSYNTEFTVEMTTGNINVKTENMYDFGISDDFLMKLFLLNVENIKAMTEQGFYKWLSNELNKELGSKVDEFYIAFTGDDL